MRRSRDIDLFLIRAVGLMLATAIGVGLGIGIPVCVAIFGRHIPGRVVVDSLAGLFR